MDEAGRGPLAGPVVAAAVVFPAGVPRRLATLLDDSKRLTAGQREAAFAALRRCRTAEIGVGAASVAEIARLNILHAAMLAMRRAVARLPAIPDLALVDGNYPPRLDCRVTCVVDGDATCLSIAAASIIAKVVRDRAMQRLAQRWPGYGWESNAGYATATHREALARLGPTRHHRAGFGTVAQLALALHPPAADPLPPADLAAAVPPLPADALPPALVSDPHVAAGFGGMQALMRPQHPEGQAGLPADEVDLALADHVFD
ncbi:MAG: ribonuclease HII [Rhodospirillales bacterium 69-11]|nr:MAG: ribonuclease HII [Rhodospirillales bacterium 69-11]